MFFHVSNPDFGRVLKFWKCQTCWSKQTPSRTKQKCQEFFLRLGETKLHGQKLSDFAYLSSKKKFCVDFEVHVFGISDLKIDTEDYVLIAGKTAMANFYMSLNFFSLQSQRRIMVSGNMFNLEADLLKNTVKIFEKGKIKNKKFKVDKNYTYMKQHRCLLDGNLTQACKYNEGVKLMSLINKIKNFKLNAKK